MRYSEMTENYIFREFKCKLSVEATAELCFKSVNTIKLWDKGASIPKECRRLMRLHSNTVGDYSEEWSAFKIENGRLLLPTGQRLTPSQVLMGAALIEISSEIELRTSTKILKVAREIAKQYSIK